LGTRWDHPRNHRGKAFVARRHDLAVQARRMPQGGIDEAGTRASAAFCAVAPRDQQRPRPDLSRMQYLAPLRPAGQDIRQDRAQYCRGRRQYRFVVRFTGTDSTDLAKWVPANGLPQRAATLEGQIYIFPFAEFSAFFHSR
jgi:hypothetical protein